MKLWITVTREDFASADLEREQCQRSHQDFSTPKSCPVFRALERACRLAGTSPPKGVFTDGVDRYRAELGNQEFAIVTHDLAWVASWFDCGDVPVFDDLPVTQALEFEQRYEEERV